MILDFQHKGLRELFDEGKMRNIPRGIGVKVSKIFDLLDASEELEDLRSAGLEPKKIRKGRFAGCWSIQASGAWQIVFRFAEGKAFGVDLVLLPLLRTLA